MSVALFARESRGIDAAGIELVVRGKRGDLAALAGNRLEAPAVVLARDLFAVKPAVRERNSAMGAGIAEGEVGAVELAAKYQWDAEQHGLCHLLAVDFRGA